MSLTRTFRIADLSFSFLPITVNHLWLRSSLAVGLLFGLGFKHCLIKSIISFDFFFQSLSMNFKLPFFDLSFKVISCFCLKWHIAASEHKSEDAKAPNVYFFTIRLAFDHFWGSKFEPFIIEITKYLLIAFQKLFCILKRDEDYFWEKLGLNFRDFDVFWS